MWSMLFVWIVSWATSSVSYHLMKTDILGKELEHDDILVGSKVCKIE